MKFEHFPRTAISRFFIAMSLVITVLRVTRYGEILGEKTESRRQEVGEALREFESEKITKEEGPGGGEKKAQRRKIDGTRRRGTLMCERECPKR